MQFKLRFIPTFILFVGVQFGGLSIAFSESNNQSACTKMLQALTRTKQVIGFIIKGGDTRVFDGNSKEKLLDASQYYFFLPYNAANQIKGLYVGLKEVRDLMRVRPMPDGLIALDHPWVTGLNPKTGGLIWPDNVLYASKNKFDHISDGELLEKIGNFLRNQAKRSADHGETGSRLKSRMPPVINYIHGSSHYNSAIIIFNDLEDGFRHFSDTRFRKELIRFVREQDREILVYFRDKNYDVQEYTFFTAYVRMVLPWFANSDGPQETIMWGNTAPYPVVNILTNAWAKDLYAMLDPETIHTIVRPPIQRQGYFESGPYNGIRISGSRWPERVLAAYTYYRVKLRGAKGNHSTLDRRKVDKPGTDNYRISHILRSEIDAQKEVKNGE